MVANSFGSAVGGQGPTLMSSGTSQYGVYADASNNMWAVKFSRTTRAITQGPYNLSSIAGNPLSLPLDAGDQHESPSIGIDDQNRVWLACNMYDYDPPRMVRSASGDITSWTDVSSQVPNPASSQHGYFRFARFADGALMLLTRCRFEYSAGDAPGAERCLYLAPSSSTFTDRGFITHGATATEDAFYRNAHYIDSTGRVHLFGAWDRDLGPGLTVDGFSYLYSDDRGVTWKNKAGTTLTTPMTRTDSSAVSMRTGTSLDSDTSNLYTSAGTALDASGNPVGVYSKQSVANVLIRWNGSAWVVEPGVGTTYPGGQGINLVNYRGDLWVMFRVNEHVELRRHASPYEMVRIAGKVTTLWYPNYDPEALRLYDSVETLVADPSPRVFTFGDGARLHV